MSECEAIINIKRRIIKFIPFVFICLWCRGPNDGIENSLDWYMQSRKTSRKCVVQKPDFCMSWHKSKFNKVCIKVDLINLITRPQTSVETETTYVLIRTHQLVTTEKLAVFNLQTVCYASTPINHLLVLIIRVTIILLVKKKTLFMANLLKYGLYLFVNCKNNTYSGSG